jgi:hypothetical protein
LKEHILARILSLDEDHLFGDDDRDGLRIIGNQINRHGTLRVNYTTYDMRRNQDSINPKTHPDILMLASGASYITNQYFFGRVIGIYHVDVVHVATAPQSQRIEFLHVRFFEPDNEYEGGFNLRRFPRIKFIDAYDPDAFGFVDPARVIRGAHIIPAFAHSTTDEFIPDSIARIYTDAYARKRDWKYYYVNMLVRLSSSSLLWSTYIF